MPAESSVKGIAALFDKTINSQASGSSGGKSSVSRKSNENATPNTVQKDDEVPLEESSQPGPSSISQLSKMFEQKASLKPPPPPVPKPKKLNITQFTPQTKSENTATRSTPTSFASLSERKAMFSNPAPKTTPKPPIPKPRGKFEIIQTEKICFWNVKCFFDHFHIYFV